MCKQPDSSCSASAFNCSATPVSNALGGEGSDGMNAFGVPSVIEFFVVSISYSSLMCFAFANAETSKPESAAP